MINPSSTALQTNNREIPLPQDENEDINCPICLEPFDEQKQITFLCKHVFHRTCIQAWRNTGASTCPMCRNDLEIAYPQEICDLTREINSELRAQNISWRMRMIWGRSMRMRLCGASIIGAGVSFGIIYNSSYSNPIITGGIICGLGSLSILSLCGRLSQEEQRQLS